MLSRRKLAEGVGFEPTVSCPTPVFKTGALNRSATPPKWHGHRCPPGFLLDASLFRRRPSVLYQIIANNVAIEAGRHKIDVNAVYGLPG